MVTIATDIGSKPNDIAWLSHADNLITCWLAAISYNLLARFGAQRVFLIGSVISVVGTIM